MLCLSQYPLVLLSFTPSLKLALLSQRAPQDISKLKQYVVVGPRRVLDTKTD